MWNACATSNLVEVPLVGAERVVLYRTACIAAALWVAFVLIVTATLSLPDWTIATPIAAVGAAIIWSTGRAARYVLFRR
jgi:hypothetical protein